MKFRNFAELNRYILKLNPIFWLPLWMIPGPDGNGDTITSWDAFGTVMTVSGTYTASCRGWLGGTNLTDQLVNNTPADLAKMKLQDISFGLVLNMVEDLVGNWGAMFALGDNKTTGIGIGPSDIAGTATIASAAYSGALRGSNIVTPSEFFRGSHSIGGVICEGDPFPRRVKLMVDGKYIETPDVEDPLPADITYSANDELYLLSMGQYTKAILILPYSTDPNWFAELLEAIKEIPC